MRRPSDVELASDWRLWVWWFEEPVGFEVLVRDFGVEFWGVGFGGWRRC